ncbi:MAG: HAD hydrolase-like protein, partial [Bdellovibrionota bacterium]
EQLHPEKDLRFEVLGKPSRLIFETALQSAGVHASRAIMFGDQLHTDIAGAQAAGIAAALLTTGITQWPLKTTAGTQPDYVIKSLISGNFGTQ